VRAGNILNDILIFSLVFMY